MSFFQKKINESKTFKLLGVLVTIFLALFILELGLREFSLTDTLYFFKTHKKMTIVMMMVLSFYYVFILSITNHQGMSTTITLLLAVILMFANYQKIAFRGEPVFVYDFENIINIKDLILMLSPNDMLKLFLAVLLLGSFLWKAIPRVRKQRKEKPVFSHGSSRLIVLFLSFLMIISTTRLNQGNVWDWLFTQTGYIDYVWDPLQTSQQNGFLPSLLYTFPGDIIDLPDGYSKEQMEKILDTYSAKAKDINKNRKRTDFEDISVVYVLSESLSDPNNIKTIQVHPSPLLYMQNENDKVAVGKMIVPIYGGGTPNTEYEILTGFDTSLLNSNMSLPYQNFLPSFDAFPSVLQTMSQKHRLIAAHNCHSKFYQRRKNFKTLGFEEVYFEDDMVHREHYRNKNYISDSEAYQEIIQYLKEDESPAFIHFITMQNHLSYPKMDELPFRYDIEGIDKDDLDDFEAYLQGITDTDLATEQFVERLRSFDKPVILVVYGDHHPPLYNDYLENDLLGRYTTDYFIYTNMDVETPASRVDPISPVYLNNLVQEIASVRISPYQAFLEEWNQQFIGFVGQKLYTTQGDLLELEELDAYQENLYHTYRLIQYDFLGGKKYLKDEFWLNRSLDFKE